MCGNACDVPARGGGGTHLSCSVYSVFSGEIFPVTGCRNDVVLWLWLWGQREGKRMSRSPFNPPIGNPHTITFLYRLKPNVGMTISGPAEREGAPRPSRANSTRRIILLPALGLSPPPSLPALQVLLISARRAHSSLQLEHERMLVSQHRMRKQISAGWDWGGEE